MIEEVITDIKTSTLSIAQTVFEELASDVSDFMFVAGSVGILFIFFNMLTGIRSMAAGEVVQWMIKFVIINAAAASMAFFDDIYNILTGVPDRIAGTLLGGDSLEEGLDAAADALLDRADHLMSRPIRNFGPALLGVALLLLCAMLTAAALVVLGVAYIGMGVAIGLAPIFILCLLFKTTSDLFSTWLKWTLGFGMTLVVTAGILGVIVSMLTGEVSTIDGFSVPEITELIILTIASLFFLIQAPGYAAGLAGTITTVGQSVTGVTMGGASAAMAGGRAASSLASGASDLGKRLVNTPSGNSSGVNAATGSVQSDALNKVNSAFDAKDRVRGSSFG